MFIKSSLFNEFVAIANINDYGDFAETIKVREFALNYIDNHLGLGDVGSSSTDLQIEYYNNVYNEVIYTLYEACLNSEEQTKYIHINDEI